MFGLKVDRIILNKNNYANSINYLYIYVFFVELTIYLKF